MGAGSHCDCFIASANGATCAGEKRVALLIGNKDYKAGVGALTNPLNDIGIVRF